MEAYYFGCVGGPGHYLHDRNLRHVQRGYPRQAAGFHPERVIYRADVPWRYLDGALAPHFDDCTFNEPRGDSIKAYCSSRSGCSRARCDAQEGSAVLHHKDGWTALAFWDRSVDKRPGSNSVFIFDAELDFNAACLAAVATFPSVWGRFAFDVVEAPQSLQAGS